MPHKTVSLSQPANNLLRRIDTDALAMGTSHLESIVVPTGKILFDVGETIPCVYFPHDMILSLLAVASDGSTVETAVIGSEGAAGLIEALGDGVSQARCVAQSAGVLSRMKVSYLRQLIETNTHFRKSMFCYIQFLFTQILQMGVCSAIHTVEARCCRMILTLRDGTGRDEILLTHEWLAGMLGVHRPAITSVTRHLQSENLIQQRRGVMIVCDAEGLEKKACECYSIIRETYDRVLPSSGHVG
jgi:CRP-like cAMP-binding protein